MADKPNVTRWTFNLHKLCCTYTYTAQYCTRLSIMTSVFKCLFTS